jgi:hypothetical protein
MVETPDGKRKRSYTIRAIPYQDPQQEAERLKAVHEARVKIVPSSERAINRFSRRKFWHACGNESHPSSITEIPIGRCRR